MKRAKESTSLEAVVKEIVQRVRNPLNALLLNIDNLEDEIAAVNIETSLQRLRRMRNTIAELDSLLCEVLRLADLPRPQITAININLLVKEVETFARAESSKKGVSVKLNLPKDLPETHGDPLQIKQAILAVLMNAIQACPTKGLVILTTERQNSYIRVVVTDNGAGIPIAHQNRIFEPFFSTKEGATGLGLPLTREILKMHQGEISFTSEVGKGTTFFISLPSKGDLGTK